MESVTLSKEEIIEATGYRRAAEQLEALRKAGIGRPPTGWQRARLASSYCGWRQPAAAQAASPSARTGVG
ncbi:DUF4224 domain-containing protein [Cupriavidus sp. 8B]